MSILAEIAYVRLTIDKGFFLPKIERCLKRHNLENFLSIFTVWRLWISEMRLAVDNGFNSAIQEIIQVEDVIFTWRSRGVLNDTIRRYFVYFC